MGSGITVRKLFQGLDVEIIGNKDLELTGVCSHSKFVAPGNLFIAKKGGSCDATLLIPEAANGGAQAVLTDLYNPFLEGAVQIIHSNPSLIEPEIVNRYFRNPSKDLFVTGITGTNGKTTTAYLIHHLLNNKGAPCGLMGTIETLIGSDRVPSKLTTADVVTNQKFLREMSDLHAENVVMEVTSHALDQKRTDGIDFNAAIFTNFSQDHLDYHGTMEKYLEAKAKLFQIIDDPSKIAILNEDDPAAKKAFGSSKAQVITFGIHAKGDFQAREIECTLEGTSFTLLYGGKTFKIKMPLIGEFNVLNGLAAIALACHRGISMQQIQRKMGTFPGVPGRLERISNTKGIHLFVDFAHTDQALEQVLTILKKIKQKKIITIFGCGGERDQSKRPKMAQVVEKFSDLMIVTSDNPRMEDPQEICDAIAYGVKRKDGVFIEVDRRRAIEQGINLSQPGDIVLIAGRGHEPFQKIGGRFIRFDDREVAREVCNLSL